MIRNIIRRLKIPGSGSKNRGSAETKSWFALYGGCLCTVFLFACDAPPFLQKASVSAEVVEYHIKNLELNLMVYRLDNYIYPTTEQGLVALIEPSEIDPRPRNFKVGGYTLMLLTSGSLPLDPWSNEYHYVSPGYHGEIDIYSLGSDGVEGGIGDAADIGNWMLDDAPADMTDAVLAWARKHKSG
jgi:general secretion pathway protein G